MCNSLVELIAHLKVSKHFSYVFFIDNSSVYDAIFKKQNFWVEVKKLIKRFSSQITFGEVSGLFILTVF